MPPALMFLSIEDVNKHFLVLLQTRRLEDRAYLLGDAALTPNDLSHISLRHLELERDGVFTLLLLDRYLRGILHKVFDYIGKYICEV